METLHRRKPTALKEHRCNYCCGTINKGEKYDYSTHVYEGEIYSWKSHFNCLGLADKLNMFDAYPDGVTQEDFCICVTERLHDIEIETGIDFNPEDFQEKLLLVMKYEGI